MDQQSEARKLAASPNSARSEGIIEFGRGSERTEESKYATEARKCKADQRTGNSGGRNGFFRIAPKEVGKEQRFGYIREHALGGEIALYSRLMGVTVQGYQKHVVTSQKPYKYAELLVQMKAIYAEDAYNQNYGKRRMYDKLVSDYNSPYSYNTVAKVMQENGLLQKKNHPKGLTKAQKNAQKSDDLLKRNFTADKPNTKVVTDITEVKCKDGKLYVSAVFDCFDNACIGLSIGDNMETPLVIQSYAMATKYCHLSGCISHSDRGSQYTSQLFRDYLGASGIIQSMNSASGRCHDNAKCESMWARAKDEIYAIFDPKHHTCAQMTEIITQYFLDYWNHRRICSAIGGMPPALKRRAYYEWLRDEVA